MRENLVIVRAGGGSLHPHWLSTQRSWDLVVSHYIEKTPDVPGEAAIYHKGTKWQGLHQLLTSRKVDWRKYRYIWLPDDDLMTNAQDIDKLFALSASLGSALSQPCLTRNSPAGWRITQQHVLFEWRRTNFVEVMAPCFRSDFLETALDTFAANASGWGLDFLWPTLLRPEEFPCYIFDDVAVVHTRPVGSANHGAIGHNPREEWNTLMTKYGIAHEAAVPLNGFGKLKALVVNFAGNPPLFVDLLRESLPGAPLDDPYFIGHLDRSVAVASVKWT